MLCNPVGCAIQAGGNAGIHPIVLSDYFERVYTWEPEPINFAAMTENLARRQIANVVPINGALGREEGRCGLNIWPPNRGAVSTTMGDEVTVEPLDPWNLEPVRFIQLDVEGDELDVLAGAKELIKRYAPYIMLEVRGHKVSRGTVDRYMKRLDYIEVDRSDSDVLYASL